MRFRSIVLLLLALVVLASTLYLRRSRSRAELVLREGEVPLPPVTNPDAREVPRPIAAPALSELQPTLDRVFEGTLIVDPAVRPAFVAGDFNGDDATDLALAVRPRSQAALSTLNAELPSWSVQDAAAPRTEAVVEPEELQVAAGEPLLAVVHGASGSGWRDPDARQCYLVKNAIGSSMRPRPLAGMPAAIRMRATRVHAGDVIVGNRGGSPGVIFWTGAAYVWADLR